MVTLVTILRWLILVLSFFFAFGFLLVTKFNMVSFFSGLVHFSLIIGLLIYGLVNKKAPKFVNFLRHVTWIISGVGLVLLTRPLITDPKNIVLVSIFLFYFTAVIFLMLFDLKISKRNNLDNQINKRVIMEKKRPVEVTIFGILSLIVGLVSIFNTLDFIKPISQQKTELKTQISQKLNTLLQLTEKTLEAIQTELNKELSPQVRRFYESKQIETTSRIKELRNYLNPNLLEENINKIVKLHLKTISEIMGLILGIVILISSIGIFLHASWLGKIIYITIPLSIIVYMLMLYVGSVIRPLLMPSPPFWSGFIILLSILFISVLAVYNFFLYYFTRPK